MLNCSSMFFSSDFQDSQNSTWLTSKSFSTDSAKTGSYGEKDLSSLTDSQLQHAIKQLHHDPAHQLWLQPVREEEVVISP